MTTVKDLLENNESVWFDIREQDFRSFLQYARDNGCTWMDGSKIDVETNNCDYHMGINNEMKLGFVSMWCWFSGASNTPKKISFKDIIEER